MSREPARKSYYGRDRERDRDRDWDRDRADYRNRPGARKRTRSPNRGDIEKRRSRSPRKSDKDMIDENILSEISKLPEPSELWEPPFQDAAFPAPPPQGFQQESVANPSYQQNYQPSYTSGLYDDFPSLAPIPQGHLPEMAQWNQMSLPPPPVLPAPVFNNVEDQMKKEAAIESEMRHQKAALSKQREDYIKKAGILKKELDTLKDQRNELRGDVKRSPSPDTKRFLKENTKLQLEIQNKLKTINNVVDMLNGIIGEEAEVVTHESDDSAERKRKSRSPSNKKSNYVYYDPEMHWCRVCNEFPPTAKDYLNHLHSPAHHKMAAAHMEAPWHTVTGMNEGFPSYPSAPTKRTPIRGLQFFVPSTAWYCKLCDQFIGDLHCASAHLKSIVHSKNYINFVEQNPHWETDWMSDRQKAFEKARASKKVEEKLQYTAHTITFNKDGFHTKSKDTPAPVEVKKKKKDKKSKRKKSSSSSSSSDTSSSDSDSPKKKKALKLKSKRSSESKALTQWMSSIAVDRLNHDDRKLLDNLKTRIKKDKEEEEKRSRSKERVTESKRREVEHRKSRSRESRSRKSRSRESRGRESRSRKSRSRESQERHSSRRRSPTRTSPQPKKPDVHKKMPFIGKMPVYKSLTKNTKAEDLKKDEQKKKDEQEMNKKRREEMDAEIQKKVAEFKEKIAKAQLERQQQTEVPSFLPLPTPLQGIQGPGPGLQGPGLPGPGLQVPGLQGPALQSPGLQGSGLQVPLPPPQLVVPTPPPVSAAQQPPPQPPPPSLPKDFQEALDIIFPSEAKTAGIVQQAQELLHCMPGFPVGVMNPFPPLGLMQPPMFGFDLFPQRPQLYDTHVPLVPSPKPRQKRPAQKQNQNHNKNNYHKPEQKQQATENAQKQKENGVAKNKEHMDDLALLGIDASDVGSGM